jgi:uncharacterized membrane protein YgcG
MSLATVNHRGWMAIDPVKGVNICGAYFPPGNLVAAQVDPSAFCGDWPPLVCYMGVDVWEVAPECDDDGAYVEFIYEALFTPSCTTTVYVQRLDWYGDRCWKTVLQLSIEAASTPLPWALTDRPGTVGVFYYRTMMLADGVIVAGVQLQVVSTQDLDCTGSGSGDGSGGSGGSSGSEGSGGSGGSGGAGNSGGSGGGLASQLFSACAAIGSSGDSLPSGVASELWLPALTGDLGGVPPVVLAGGWCYSPATPTQYRSDAPDESVSQFFSTCQACEQYQSIVGTGSGSGSSSGGGSSGGGCVAPPGQPCANCCWSYTGVFTTQFGTFGFTAYCGGADEFGNAFWSGTDSSGNSVQITCSGDQGWVFQGGFGDYSWILNAGEPGSAEGAIVNCSKTAGQCNCQDCPPTGTFKNLGTGEPEDPTLTINGCGDCCPPNAPPGTPDCSVYCGVSVDCT